MLSVTGEAAAVRDSLRRLAGVPALVDRPGKQPLNVLVCERQRVIAIPSARYLFGPDDVQQRLKLTWVTRCRARCIVHGRLKLRLPFCRSDAAVTQTGVSLGIAGFDRLSGWAAGPGLT